QFETDFSHYMPLGIYLSHDFLQRHPHFMEQFNGQLKRCAPAALQLSNTEQQRIHAQVQTAIQPLLPAAKMLPALDSGNKRLRVLTVAEKMALDQQWFSELSSGNG